MNKNIDISNVRLETDRLILRAFNEDDLKDFNEYAKVEGVGEMAGWKHHESLDESEDILLMFIREKNIFAIVLKENNKVIGSIGIHNYNEDIFSEELKMLLGCEIGYVLSKEYWGQSIMVEANKAIMDYLFNKEKFNFLTCSHFDFNNQSKRVIEKLGYKYFNRNKTKYLNDKSVISLNYVLRKEDFKK